MAAQFHYLRKVLAELRGHGVTVRRDGRSLIVTGYVPDEFREVLVTRAADIAALLAATDADPADDGQRGLGEDDDPDATQLSGQPSGRRAVADVPPAELSRSRWDEVGLFEWNGVVTHALGDAHARKLLSGEVSFERAKREHEYATRQAARFAQGGLTRWTR